MARPCAQLDRRSPRQGSYWLWMLVVAMAALIVTATVANAFLPAGRAVTRDAFGQDFLAFYTAGRLVTTDHIAALYDLDAITNAEHAIASDAGYPQAAAVAPWWNPPHVAWLFAPFSMLPFRTALVCWTAFSLACLACAARLLTPLIADVSGRRSDWMLVPALLIVSPPAIQSLGHGQNTMLSLLLLTLTVLAWREGRPLLAGVACATLCYKPQLAVIVGVALIATLGWRVIVGLLIGIVPQLLVATVTLPGSIVDFVTRVPANLQTIQFGQPYLWHRHATFTGFWRFLLQGNTPGETHGYVTAIALACSACVAVGLVLAWWKLRNRLADDDNALDRLIALVILATPLLMPFFFDYDLLLLGVAGVLIARDLLATGERSTSTLALRVAGGAVFVWLLINPPLAEATGANLTVPLLTFVFALQVRRCTRSETAIVFSAAPSVDERATDVATRLAA